MSITLRFPAAKTAVALTLTLALAWLPIGRPLAQSMGGGTMTPGANANATKLDTPAPEGGWDALARLLESLKPSVDTRLDPTPSQITDHIEKLLNNDQADKALAAIERRQAELAAKPNGSTDAQLMFQHARALAELGRTDEAIAIYDDMTVRFPELPEPWNNLGVLYAARGDLDSARDAIRMALRANPDYPAARANLADLQLMLALRTYREAAKQGVPGMKTKAAEIEAILKDHKR